MFNRFTDRVKRVMALARKEAVHFRHAFIAPEHILVGLIEERKSFAATVLRDIGITTPMVRRVIESEVVQAEPSGPVHGPIPFTPGAKRILELSREEADRLGHPWIGTEHVLLGILRHEVGIPATVLQELRLEPESLRPEIYQRLFSSGSVIDGQHTPVSVSGNALADLRCGLTVEHAGKAVEIRDRDGTLLFRFALDEDGVPCVWRFHEDGSEAAFYRLPEG